MEVYWYLFSAKPKRIIFSTGRSLMKLLSPVVTAMCNINHQLSCTQYKILCCPAVSLRDEVTHPSCSAMIPEEVELPQGIL